MGKNFKVNYLKQINFLGHYKDGKKNGRGRYTLPTGDIIEGNFKDDIFDGNGDIYKINSGI